MMRPFVFERALVGQVRGRDGVLDRVADRGEELMAERFFRDAVEVVRRGIMIVVRQAVGLAKCVPVQPRACARSFMRCTKAEILPQTYSATTLHASLAEEIMAQ